MPKEGKAKYRTIEAVIKIYCKTEEEEKDMKQMPRFFANVEWSKAETEESTTWVELFICFKMMGGESKGDEAKEEMLEKRSTLQQAMKDFKQTLRKTAKITMKEEDEWLIKPSKIIKNNLSKVDIQNRQAAVKGTIRMEGWGA